MWFGIALPFFKPFFKTLINLKCCNTTFSLRSMTETILICYVFILESREISHISDCTVLYTTVWCTICTVQSVQYNILNQTGLVELDCDTNDFTVYWFFGCISSHHLDNRQVSGLCCRSLFRIFLIRKSRHLLYIIKYVIKLGIINDETE